MDDSTRQSSQSPDADQTATPGGGTGAAARMKEEVSHPASSVRSSVSELGQLAADKIKDSREVAAGTLDQTASTLHSGADRVASTLHSGADQLVFSSAVYLQRSRLPRASDCRFQGVLPLWNPMTQGAGGGIAFGTTPDCYDIFSIRAALNKLAPEDKVAEIEERIRIAALEESEKE